MVSCGYTQWVYDSEVLVVEGSCLVASSQATVDHDRTLRPFKLDLSDGLKMSKALGLVGAMATAWVDKYHNGGWQWIMSGSESRCA